MLTLVTSALIKLFSYRFTGVSVVPQFNNESLFCV